jgi:DNA-directed RNA polymerase subunit E'/Rpb7
MSIVSPYKDIEQFTKIKIQPSQINSDIRNNMKMNLKKKVEKKCNKNGFVDEVYKIISFEDGIMPPENLSGNIIFNIKYHCRLCLPIEDSIIIGNIKTINQELIIATNGPIFIFIPKENIENNIWNLEDFTEKKSKNKLQINSFVKIKILNKRVNQNDYQIKSIGYLLDFATNQEVKDYYGNIIEEDEDEEGESNFII